MVAVQLTHVGGSSSFVCPCFAKRVNTQLGRVLHFCAADPRSKCRTFWPSPSSEAPTTVDPKALRKAFTAPKTVMDFFKPRPAAGPAASAPPGALGAAASSSSSIGGGAAAAAAAGPAGLKRAASEAAASAPAAKRAGKAGGAGKPGSVHGSANIGAMLARQQAPQAAQRQQQTAAPPAVVVDLAAEDSRDGSEPAAAPVLRASTRHNDRPPSAAGTAGGGKARGGGGSSGGGGGGGGGPYVPVPADVEMLTALGFAPQQAERALRVTQGNLERAANWLLAGN